MALLDSPDPFLNHPRGDLPDEYGKYRLVSQRMRRIDRDTADKQTLTTICSKCGRKRIGLLPDNTAWFKEHSKKGCR